jgi:hypothetical protein
VDVLNALLAGYQAQRAHYVNIGDNIAVYYTDIDIAAVTAAIAALSA